jgi:hypothetical protein
MLAVCARIREIARPRQHEALLSWLPIQGRVDFARHNFKQRRSPQRGLMTGGGVLAAVLILKRASASSPSGERSDDDFDVLGDGIVVGGIMKAMGDAMGSGRSGSRGLDRGEVNRGKAGRRSNVWRRFRRA